MSTSVKHRGFLFSELELFNPFHGNSGQKDYGSAGSDDRARDGLIGSSPGHHSRVGCLHFPAVSFHTGQFLLLTHQEQHSSCQS